jgi:hypothetical protein
MPSLRELQLQLVANLLDPAAASAAAFVVETAIPARERIGFYRNNVMSNFRETLRAVHPVIERLVGTHFFDRAADAYLRAHPSTSGDLNLYSEHFADFVETWTPAGELPYLADVARLEWCIEQSFHAADRASLTVQDLAAVPAERQAELTFELHPSCHLLASTWPIQHIWQANQPGASEDIAIDLTEGGVFLLARRHQHEVVIETLDRGGFSMLSLLAIGRTFEDAWGSAVAAQADFNLTAFLQQHVVAGVFADFSERRHASTTVAPTASGESASQRRDQSFSYA